MDTIMHITFQQPFLYAAPDRLYQIEAGDCLRVGVPTDRSDDLRITPAEAKRLIDIGVATAFRAGPI